MNVQELIQYCCKHEYTEALGLVAYKCSKGQTVSGHTEVIEGHRRLHITSDDGANHIFYSRIFKDEAK